VREDSDGRADSEDEEGQVHKMISPSTVYVSATSSRQRWVIDIFVCLFCGLHTYIHTYIHTIIIIDI
jgi:hypothetical protein